MKTLCISYNRNLFTTLFLITKPSSCCSISSFKSLSVIYSFLFLLPHFHDDGNPKRFWFNFINMREKREENWRRRKNKSFFSSFSLPFLKRIYARWNNSLDCVILCAYNGMRMVFCVFVSQQRLLSVAIQ